MRPSPWLSACLAAGLLFQSGCAGVRRQKDRPKEDLGRAEVKFQADRKEPRGSIFPDLRMPEEKVIAGMVCMAAGAIIIASIGSHLANTAPADWNSPDGFRIGVAATLLMGGSALFSWGQAQKRQR